MVPPGALDAADSRRIELAATISLEARPVLLAVITPQQRALSDASLGIAEHSQGKAAALLLGAALEAACRDDHDAAALALGAVVHLLRAPTLAKLKGVPA